MKNKKPILIQSDFDNSITIGNVSEQIHDKFGPANWDTIYQNYRSGKISVEESNIYSFQFLNFTEKQLNEFVCNNVKFRKGFKQFYDFILNKKIDYKIVSSGVDFYIKSSLKSIGIDCNSVPIYSGISQFVNDGIEIKYIDPFGNPISSEFKNSFTEYHKDNYSKIIYLGDSLTDLNSSLKSDYVFATSKLYDYYVNNNLDCFYFDSYEDVLAKINELID